MYDTDLWIIKKYIDIYTDECKNANDTEAFERYSYSRWAAGEIMTMVAEEHIFKPPPFVTGKPAKTTTDIIEEFAFDMDRRSRISTDERCRRMFAIARDTADDILYFYVHERRKKDGQA